MSKKDIQKKRKEIFSRMHGWPDLEQGCKIDLILDILESMADSNTLKVNFNNGEWEPPKRTGTKKYTN